VLSFSLFGCFPGLLDLWGPPGGLEASVGLLLIEAIVARRITWAAEAYRLLPDEQMGNRAHRSTELAIRLVVAQVHEA